MNYQTKDNSKMLVIICPIKDAVDIAHCAIPSLLDSKQT